eukprot:3562352-Prymnesium_polylepis.1
MCPRRPDTQTSRRLPDACQRQPDVPDAMAQKLECTVAEQRVLYANACRVFRARNSMATTSAVCA